MLRGIAASVLMFQLIAYAQDASSAAKHPSHDARREAIARAKVWQPTDIPSMDLRTGPQGKGAFAPGETVACDYAKKKFAGASRKFACRLDNGDVVKVKYGATNGEVYGEVAASRLLWALGFGADRMYSVKVVCRGCPDEIPGVNRADGGRLIEPAAIERKMPGEELSDEWSWRELDKVDESAGGATRAERDAFKLLAVFLQHTDSKPVQQRLLCVDAEKTEDRCDVPLMMINDLGLTFGHANTFNAQKRGSMHLEAWASVPIWKGRHGCVGNLDDSITGTLFDPKLSEQGRTFLANLLSQLSDQQLRDLFSAARVDLRLRNPGDPKAGYSTVDEWVDVFKKKRTEIVDRRCDT